MVAFVPQKGLAKVILHGYASSHAGSRATSQFVSEFCTGWQTRVKWCMPLSPCCADDSYRYNAKNDRRQRARRMRTDYRWWFDLSFLMRTQTLRAVLDPCFTCAVHEVPQSTTSFKTNTTLTVSQVSHNPQHKTSKVCRNCRTCYSLSQSNVSHIYSSRFFVHVDLWIELQYWTFTHSKKSAPWRHL